MNAGDKVLVARPNFGKGVMTAQYVARRIRYGEYNIISEIEARDAWEKEVSSMLSIFY